ncbi:hypothetical protein GCM10027418_13130 [Mariniluteicoccus endophyticus]
MTNDPDETLLRPRGGEPARPGPVVPADAWNNIDAWNNTAAWRGPDTAPHQPSQPSPPAEGDVRPPSADDQPRPRTTVVEAEDRVHRPHAAQGPLRRTAPERPAPIVPVEEEPSKTQRVGLALLTTTLLSVVAMVIPTLLVPTEASTSRAVSVAHGPLPRKAEIAKLPDAVGDLRRDARANTSPLPYNHVDRGVYADSQGARALVLHTQKAKVDDLEDLDRRMGLQAARFGRISCGRRYDGLQCTMLLDGGTLTASTNDRAWEPETLAAVVRQAYASLPQD